MKKMSHRNHRAFTLIEMMIAISLGMLLVYAAMAGFRVTSQTVTSANRLAFENSLLRAGFSEALHELDFWTAYDDPESADSTDRALRNAGMPFSPLVLSPELEKTQIRVNRATNEKEYIYYENDTFNPGNLLKHQAWDATYPWPASSSRTWWRANAAEWNDSNGRSGDYSQFASQEYSRTIGLAPQHAWLFNQMHMLHDKLGYYAFCDYLPPSMLYTYIGRDTEQGGRIDMMRKFTKNGTSFRSSDGGSNHAQGRYRCTKNTSFWLVPLKPLGTAKEIKPVNFRDKIETGIQTSELKVGRLMELSLSTRPQLVDKPIHWPSVELQVMRILNHNRFICLNKISLTNSQTGQSTELSFTAIGTTLRGARQQRKPGRPTDQPGWAAWYGPNDSKNDASLDFGIK